MVKRKKKRGSGQVIPGSGNFAGSGSFPGSGGFKKKRRRKAKPARGPYSYGNVRVKKRGKNLRAKKDPMYKKYNPYKHIGSLGGRSSKPYSRNRYVVGPDYTARRTTGTRRLTYVDNGLVSHKRFRGL